MFAVKENLEKEDTGIYLKTSSAAFSNISIPRSLSSRFRFLWLTFLLYFILTSTFVCAAQDISFEATVDSNTVELNNTLQLTLTLNGGKIDQAIELPTLDGFEVRYLGPSTRVSIINGQVSQSYSYIYVLYPKKTGKFTIPPIEVSIDGKKYSSQPIEMQVVDPGQAAASSGGAAGNRSGTPMGLEEKIFVVLAVPREEVFLNEKIPVTVKLFVNQLYAQDIEYPVFDHDGFVIDEIKDHKQYQQMIGGTSYNVIEFKTNVYPTRVGELKLGPARLNMNILYEGSRRSPGSSNPFFDDDFFNSFLKSYEKRPFSAASAEVSVKVLPLPEEGKPQDFSGAVGQFEFDASAGPLEVTLGDPVTLKVKVWGNGNLKAVNVPSVSNQEGFKTYDPQVKEEGGIKSLEQIVIPQNENIKEIPLLKFSYFDPVEKTYKTVTKGPFPLKVVKSAGQDFKMLEFSSPASKEKPKENLSEETIGRDIIFIKENPGKWVKIGRPLYKNGEFIGLVVFFVFLWTGFLIWYRFTHRFKTDTVFARRLLAPHKAKKGLQEAKNLMSQGKQKEFYDRLFKTLQEYFGDKFHLPVASVTFAIVEKFLTCKPVKMEILDNIRSVFEECDRVRYASGSINVESMQAAFQKVEKAIDHCERFWR